MIARLMTTAVILVVCLMTFGGQAQAVLFGETAFGPSWEAVVSLNGGACTATFIHPRFAITAAHCMKQCEVNQSDTYIKSRKVNVLSANPNYSEFWLQTGTALHETGDSWAFAAMANDDLMAIKRSGTDTNSTEVHILSAASNYTAFRLQTGTALHETEGSWSFVALANDDLMAIKRSGTDTNSTEVHILSAASNYTAFRLHTGTALHETGGSWSFVALANDDLMAIKRLGTGTNSTEVHILSAASNYTAFRLHTGTALHETGDNWAFTALANDDLMAIKRLGTGTNSTEVHILSAASNYTAFRLQTGTALHETGGNWSFVSMANDDLMAIKQLGTDTNSTEVHILSAASNYTAFRLQTGTALHETGDSWAFASLANDDLMAIKRSGTDTNSTEVHILSAASNYTKFRLHTGTALHETGDNWSFVALANDDLMAIKRSGTGTNSTEVHILSAASNYTAFRLQTGTALHETGDNWSFVALANDDLMAIKRSGTGTNSTQVHILSAASNYTAFRLQTGTALHETGDNWSFVALANDDLMTIKRSGTGTNSTQVHILSAASNYTAFRLQTGTALHETGDNWAFVALANDDLMAIGSDVSQVGCVTGTPDEVVKGNWVGREGKPDGALFAHSGVLAGAGTRFDFDYIYFPTPEEMGRSISPDVALLRSTTVFTGRVIPMLPTQDLPQPDESRYCRRYEYTWPTVVGFSPNSGIDTQLRRQGRSFAECDLELDETLFKLDAHGRDVRGVRTCTGDSGGPVLWQTGFGAYAVGGINSVGDMRNPNDPFISNQMCRNWGNIDDRLRGESGHAFIPANFLNRVAQSDAICGGAREWDTCANGVIPYNGYRLRFLGTEIDQCGDDSLRIPGVAGEVHVPRGGTGAVELGDRRFRWYCGGSREWTTAPGSTRFVIVKRGITDRQIIWDSYEILERPGMK